MKKNVTKIIYLILSLPIVLLLYQYPEYTFNVLEKGNNFIATLLTVVVTDIYVVINLIRKNEEKQVSSIMFFIAVLTIFHLFFNILIPIWSNIENFVLLIGLVLFGIIFFLFYIGLIINILSDYKKEGFNPFKKIERFTPIQLISKDVEKLDTYQKMLLLNNNLIVVNESGIFEIVNFTKKGILKGNINEEIWYFDDKEIKNPFILKTTNSFFVSNPNTYFKANVKLIPKSKIYLVLDKYLNKKIYSKEQIDKIYTDLEVKYGNNQN